MELVRRKKTVLGRRWESSTKGGPRVFKFRKPPKEFRVVPLNSTVW
jgi:hypothetical protein